ncbi:hypothetical protein [Paraburkholderia saeva]|uniref:Secreted protein n=1 Tax=Paraburkholderia saeva TaxID=2777537 RepID=A0A9N8X175_9BURK|nr:hypothetical protein [Paraburkholderia saeva]CAG4897773.1 hypothetical protein LMG31841_02516 [Paraburkholderia saeva]CAG4913247.1 hypothetical protein R52603_04109 [Paraburkholderia saeva]CAG4919289.1 hypothetical protein R70241_04730 [Paraburkholderia saeva]
MTSPCRALLVLACCVLAVAPAVSPAQNAAQGHDYPTQGRVEYVLGCMDDNGHDFANVYKCSCAIDHIAAALPYDDFVEQSTFAKYATLGGEGGAEFRVDRARAQSKKFLTLQSEAYKVCGVSKTAAAAAPANK